nr:PREDICTED: glomulin [Lepisosteus oculatus]
MALEQLYDMLQRCQVLADDSFKPEDYEQFQSAGRACLERGGAAQVLEVVQDEKNKAIVRSMGWNLLGPLVQVILQKDEKSLQHCLSIFAHLLDWHCTALPAVLLKLGDKKAASVGMALSTILNQLSRLPVPYTREQEEDDAHGLCRCCTALPGFVGPLVEEAKQTRPGGRGAELRTELLKFCMKSLREPLLQAQLGDDPDSPADSPLRRFASQILATLLSLGESLPHLLFHHVLKKKEETGFLEEDARYSRESLACLAYLLFVQRAAIDRFPAVFSPVFVLRCNMQYVDILLSRTEESRVSKGLDLYEQSLVRTEDGSLPVELLELRVFLSVPQNLVKVMTLCPIPHLRTKGLAVFQLSIDKLDMEAKYKFFRCLLKTSHHAGVEGYIIKNIKNQIDFALKPGNGSVWFSGAQLLPLLRSVLTLPEGPETDLLQNLDRVMESLNLLRYLLIRDKEWDNQTGIWTELYKIEENYLKPLRTGLNMSKAHYEAELKSTKEIKKLKGQKESRPVCTVTVGNEKLPNMTPEMQVQVLHSALFTFDLMESVLTRIEEIIEVKVKP